MRDLNRLSKFLLALACALAVLGVQRVARAADPAPKPKARVVELAVTAKGFEPSPVTVKKGEPLELKVTRKTDDTCATDLVVPGYGIEQKLPLNQTVSVRLTPKAAGQLKYGCAMGQMVAGVLVVE